MSENILAIDPGKDKCGLAILDRDGKVAEKKVISASALTQELADLANTHEIKTLILGSGTGGKTIERQIVKLELPVNIIFANERYTTLEARRRYFKDNPPQGWRRFIPTSLQLPPVPYDDYAAVILGERYLEGRI